MDNKITSYIPLLEAWETFLKKQGNHDLSNFAQWLTQREQEQVIKTTSDMQLEEYFNKNTDEYSYSFQSSEAAFLIWRLSKFIRHYVKPILTDKGLSSQDDFAILAHIDYLKTCSKKEAVEANIIEPTTGIEIIKRLVKQKLILEKENKEDKRQKLVSLTKKGQDLLKEIYIGFSGIQDVLADMKTDERLSLISVLKKLDNFHTSNIKEKSK
jgi:DNA-binding MarR family transcriptional regulator